eukprot:5284139-Prymnesium_polylepis.1
MNASRSTVALSRSRPLGARSRYLWTRRGTGQAAGRAAESGRVRGLDARRRFARRRAATH